MASLAMEELADRKARLQVRSFIRWRRCSLVGALGVVGGVCIGRGSVAVQLIPGVACRSKEGVDGDWEGRAGSRGGMIDWRLSGGPDMTYAAVSASKQPPMLHTHHHDAPSNTTATTGGVARAGQ